MREGDPSLHSASPWAVFFVTPVLHTAAGLLIFSIQYNM